MSGGAHPESSPEPSAPSTGPTGSRSGSPSSEPASDAAARSSSLDGAAQAPEWHSVPPMRYPNEYLFFVFVSSLDIILTWAILKRDGAEVNPVAAVVIDHWGLRGAIAFKFSLMLFVILACEWIGRRHDARARLLIKAAIVVSALPVVWSVVLLTVHHYL